MHRAAAPNAEGGWDTDGSCPRSSHVPQPPCPCLEVLQAWGWHRDVHSTDVRAHRAEGLSGVGAHSSPTTCPSPHAPSGCYSLSVRRSEHASWDSVTHYRIHRLENGWLYISPRLTFPSLHDLVDHYSGNALPAP